MNYPYGRSSHFGSLSFSIPNSPSCQVVQLDLLRLGKFPLFLLHNSFFVHLTCKSCSMQSSRALQSVEVNEQPRMISSGNQSLTTQRTSIHFVWRYDRWSAPTLVLLLVPGIHLNFPSFNAFIFNRPSVKFFEFRQSYCVLYLVLSKSNSSTQRPVCSHQELIKCWIAL